MQQKYFLEYFENKDYAVAYKLKNVKVYSTYKKLADYGLLYAPQSFVYL